MTVNYRELSVEKIDVTYTETPLALDDAKVLHTDHMVLVDWDIDNGWSIPRILPYSNLSLDPASSVLHYSTTCFEGMKAYRSLDGKQVRLFRPEDNVARLNDSLDRICLPRLEPEAALTLIKEFTRIDARFIPAGGVLYLRPFVMGSNPNLGLSTPTQAKFIIVANKKAFTSFNPLKLYCSHSDTIRAWPGGFGYAKLGANYGPTLVANRDALKKGYDQVLWLLDGVVTEAGASTFFAAVQDKTTGRHQIWTCPLSAGVVLPGITRRSVLQLLRENFADRLDVLEKSFTIDDLQEAYDEDRLMELFVAGTAYFITPVKEILSPKNKTIRISSRFIPEQTENGHGTYSSFSMEYLSKIMWGNNSEHAWCTIIGEDEKVSIKKQII